ncbi:RING-HC finger protein [Endozoicomonas ascidiicola]|uniref:RING-HC finger protein n=1 Tax=Endozoicomonas ascidiicola TaxID=1698521 RepID=UPI00082FF377|nr:RING-HC finger protein [Endozoicomonas ascidiicola]
MEVATTPLSSGNINYNPFDHSFGAALISQQQGRMLNYNVTPVPGRGAIQSDAPNESSGSNETDKMCRHIARIVTFNTAEGSLFHLAEFGFFHIGNNQLQCFSCQSIIADLPDGYSVSDMHWHKANCALANGSENRNIPLSGAQPAFSGSFPATHSTQEASGLLPSVRHPEATNRTPFDELEDFFQDRSTRPSTSNQQGNGQLSATSTSNTHQHAQRTTQEPTQNHYPENQAHRHPDANSASVNFERLLAEQYPCLNPFKPEYADLVDRITTFHDVQGRCIWRGLTNAEPLDIAASGMVYLNNEDRTKCYYCNGGLNNWERDDDPWFEHAKWYPHCEHLLRNKGPLYVHEVTCQFPNLRRPNPLRSQASTAPSLRQVESGPENLNIPYNESETPSFQIIDPQRERQNQESKIRSWMDSNECANTAKDMGFEESHIFMVIKRKLDGGNNSQDFFPFPSASDLVDALIETQNEYESLASNNEEQATTSEPHVEQMSGTSQPQEQTQEAEVARLEAQKKCKICHREESCVVFVPCGHLTACVPCGERARNCPVCKTHITEKVRSYLS